MTKGITTEQADEIKEFLRRVKNVNKDVKWRHYKPLFEKFIHGHSTKTQLYRIKSKSAYNGYITYPPMKWQVIVPDTSFLDFVKRIKELGLFVETEKDRGKLNIELVERFTDITVLLR